VRKITKETARALLNGGNITKGNTHVQTVELPHMSRVGQLFLFGNLIATYELDEGVNRLTISHGNYKVNGQIKLTSTTKERLNGILKIFGINWHIFQSRVEWFIRDFMGRDQLFLNNITFNIDR